MLTNFLSDARYWFEAYQREKLSTRKVMAKPPTLTPYGGLVYFIDREYVFVEIDYADPADRKKVQGAPIGIGWRDRFDGSWRVEVLCDAHRKAEGKGLSFAEAFAAAVQKRDQILAFFDALDGDPALKLEFLLQGHDWWYQKSDDYGYWMRGMENEGKILKLVQILEPEKVRALWAKFAPVEFSCPV